MRFRLTCKRARAQIKMVGERRTTKPRAASHIIKHDLDAMDRDMVIRQVLVTFYCKRFNEGTLPRLAVVFQVIL